MPTSGPRPIPCCRPCCWTPWDTTPGGTLPGRVQEIPGHDGPAGKGLRPHPGYLGTPKVYQAINWISDNGALLWAFSQHALLSGDEKFIAAYTPAIVKSCQWIRDARRSTGHGGIEGILPPAVATDEGRQVQSVWNDGWNYKGLITAVRLLKRIKHPRAAEFEAEAKDYRARFRSAFAEAAKKTPTWTDAAGKVHPMAPRSLSGDKDFGINHAFYLDAGPLFLVFAGLMDADDELIRSSRAWFREGPPRKTYQDNGNCWQTPSLHHEMSSCEPCLQLGVLPLLATRRIERSSSKGCTRCLRGRLRDRPTPSARPAAGSPASLPACRTFGWCGWP